MELEGCQVRQTRHYRQVARAAAGEATERRIFDAARQFFGALPFDQVSLKAVADQAGTGVHTVLRRFGSKEQLFAAVADGISRQIRQERDAAPAGDIAGAVRNLLDNYERWGEHFLNLLAQEQRVAAIRSATDRGRRYHHAWVERAFSPLLAHVAPAERPIRLAQLVVATDLYTWKVLRRDLGLGRDAAERAMRDLVEAITSRR
jgi:AcrR family transcriptional regulator